MTSLMGYAYREIPSYLAMALEYYVRFFFNVITVISGQMPNRPEKARKPNPRFTYR